MSRRRFPNQPIVFAATSPARPHCVRPQRRPRTPAVRLARRWHEWCGAEHSVRGSQRVSASAGLTVAVGAATNLCSKIVSPETMMAEQGGPTISRVGRIVPEVILGAPGRAEADPSASSRISPIARGVTTWSSHRRTAAGRSCRLITRSSGGSSMLTRRLNAPAATVITPLSAAG
jgi:hypothetical protein